MTGNRFLPLKQHWNKNEEEVQAFFNFFTLLSGHLNSNLL